MVVNKKMCLFIGPEKEPIGGYIYQEEIRFEGTDIAT